MNRGTKVCLCIIIGLLAIIYFTYDKKTVIEPKVDPFEDIIKQDSIIRDSVIIVIDSIKTKIVYIDHRYDEKVSDIMSSSDSVNLRFFSEYIEHYNNQRTVKDSEPNIR